MLPIIGRKVLLVEPAFPIPPKSKNHKNFLPVGLLKIGAWLNNTGHEVKLVRGLPSDPVNDMILTGWQPDEVWVTSLFTYWSPYVREAVSQYRARFPAAYVIVGGIYASLMPEQCQAYTECDEVRVGVQLEAERCFPDYSLLAPFSGANLDYQIVHASRGCFRHCAFCGTWKVEPKFGHVNSLIPELSPPGTEIVYKKLVFYDNNLLSIPSIESLLGELATLRREKKIIWCESQSGFDGRLLLKKRQLAPLIKAAGFRNVRVAWDWGMQEADMIEEELQLLKTVGYNHKDLYVFMLYNWNIPFEEMEQKRIQCWKWQVQIADCRFRPLDRTYDHYNPRVSQTADEYYVHADGNWTDAKVKQFRQNVRRQNIAVRQGYKFYSRYLETHKIVKHGEVKNSTVDPWYPSRPHPPTSLLWGGIPETSSSDPHVRAQAHKEKLRHKPSDAGR